jgi:hypothetical protein
MTITSNIYYGAPEDESILNEYWDAAAKRFVSPASVQPEAAMSNSAANWEASRYLRSLADGNQA